MNTSKFWKPLDYFFSARPVLFIPGWSTMLAGYAGTAGIMEYSHLLSWKIMPTLMIMKMLVIFATAMGGCFLLNQLQDRYSDRMNNKLFIISEGIVKQKEAQGLAILTLLISLILAGLINVRVLAVDLIFIFITGYVYNYPPFVAKDRPIGSLAANAIMGALAFALGWLAMRKFSWNLIPEMSPYLLFNTALYFFTMIPDRNGDAAAHKKTLAVTLPLTHLIYWSFIVYVAGLIFAVMLNDLRAILIFLPTLPFYLLTMKEKSQEAAVKTTKFGIFFFAMVICLQFWWYFFLLLFIFILTRWYFQKRFNFNYPSFRA